MVKFIRRDAAIFPKFGKGTGKKAKWRNPTGRHNKMRLKIKGHPVSVSIGYKNTEIEKPKMIFNIKDIENLTEKSNLLLGKIGKKTKIEIAKYSKENNVKFTNFNQDKFLKDLEKEKKKNELKK